MGKRQLYRALFLVGLVLCAVLHTLSAASATPPYNAKTALKSNLLFWAAGAPNVGAEFYFSGLKHFSIGITAAAAKWSIDNTLALQTLQGGLDTKYWFNPGKRYLTGPSVGLYALYGGRYDIQWRAGWQGDSFFSAGLAAGWSIPVGRRFNLEFALAAGWFHTPEARRYEIRNSHLVWQQTRYNVDRFSLTKAQVNLVWLFGREEGSR